MIYLCDISNLSIDKHEFKSLESYVGHLLLKYALRKRCVNLEECIIKYNENGKPYIKDINFHYNISHSKNLVCLIISDNECGIDIQYYDNNRNFDKIVDKYFTNNHKENYYKLDNDDRNKFFYQIWVQIEAHIKMLGSNMIKAKELKYPEYKVLSLKDKLSNSYYLASSKEEDVVTISYNDLI